MKNILKRLLPYDKLLHLNIGALFVYLFSYLFDNNLVLLGGVIALGISKELYDKHVKKSEYDWWDVAYTVLGGILIIIITWKC